MQWIQKVYCTGLYLEHEKCKTGRRRFISYSHTHTYMGQFYIQLKLIKGYKKGFGWLEKMQENIILATACFVAVLQNKPFV